jgi:hypothetical protein
MLAKPSAQKFPSLKICETMKFMDWVSNKQLCHLLLNTQGTNKEDLKAKTTRVESVSGQMLFQFLEAAISMAFIAPHNSSTNAGAILVFSTKPYKKSTLEFLNNPPQEEELVKAPSVLHFTQLVEALLSFLTKLIKAMYLENGSFANDF